MALLEGFAEAARERKKCGLRRGGGESGPLITCHAITRIPSSQGVSGSRSCPEHTAGYRDTSLIRNRPPRRTTIGPWAQPYCRVLKGRGLL